MIGFFLARLTLISALLLLPGVLPARAGDPDTERLTVRTASGARHVFDVEVARTPKQRETGLMYRRSMAADHGMLFDFGRVDIVAMWMKNTYLPLDMLFIDKSGRIVKIARRTVPFSRTIIYSGAPVLAVLEINGGVSDRLGIREGDTVLHPLFDASPEAGR